MSRCEHNEKITHFCLTDICAWKESAGCESCMKKYHGHLGKTNIITEKQITQMMQKFIMPTQVKSKCRAYQQAVYNYINFIKTQFGSSIDFLCRNIMNRLGSPSVYRSGHLQIYKKIKSADFKKINQKQLIDFFNFAKTQQKSQIQIEQKVMYHQEASKAYEIMSRINQTMQQMGKIMNDYETEFECGKAFYQKIIEINNERKTQNNSKKNNEQSDKKKYEQGNGLVKKKSSKDTNDAKQPKIRKTSVDYQIEPLKIAKSSKYDEQEQQIIERKKRLMEIMNKSGPNEQQERKNIVSLEKTPEKEKEKESQAIRPRVNSLAKKIEGRELSSEEKEKIQKTKLFDLLLKKGINITEIVAHTLLPLGEDKQQLYEHKKDVQKKTITVPMKQLVEQEEPASPLLKKRKTNTMAKEFTIGLQKVKANNEEVQQIQETPKKNQQQKVQLINDNQANSLALLVKAVVMDPVQAIPILQSALKEAQNNLSAAEYLSFLYVQNHQARQCLDLCNKFLGKIEHSPMYQQLSIHLTNNKAAALNILGRYSESIPILQRCISYLQKDVFYKNLADSYFALGIIQKSLINYEKAISLNNNNDQAYYNMAVCLYNQKNYSSSKLSVLKAIKLCPNNLDYLQLNKNLQGKFTD